MGPHYDVHGNQVTRAETTTVHWIHEPGPSPIEGPCRLSSIILVSGTYSDGLSYAGSTMGNPSELILENQNGPVMKLKAEPSCSTTFVLPVPLACPEGLTAQLFGTGAEAYIYVIEGE